MDDWTWVPLRVALAWCVSAGDEEFTRKVSEHRPLDETEINDFNWKGVLSAVLIDEMAKAGCLLSKAGRWQSFMLAKNYTGPFQRTAAEFTALQLHHPNGMPCAELIDKIERMLDEAARTICERIRDDGLPARGIRAIDGRKEPAADIPPSAISEKMVRGPLMQLLQEPESNISWESVLLYWPKFLKGDASHLGEKIPQESRNPERAPARGPNDNGPLVREAMKTKYPDGVPRGTLIKEVRATLIDFIKTQYGKSVSSKTLQRLGIRKDSVPWQVT